MRKIKIAIIAPSMAESGGVRSVVKFLVDSLLKLPDRYELDLISIAASHKDRNSRRLLAPNTWFKTLALEKDELWGLDLYHVGSNWSEFEFQRYKARKVLDELVEQYDVVQLVCGLPVWGNIAKHWKVPMCMQVATLTKLERSAGSASGGPGLLSYWRKLMTNITIKLDHKGVQFAKVVLHENELFEQWMDKNFPSISKRFAPPGIDTSIFFKNESAEDPSPLVKGRYILNVGRLNDPRKDTSTLVKAYASYLKSADRADHVLVIAGKNDPVPELTEVISEYGLESSVNILQDVSYDHLIKLYHNADFFVLSSKEEGLGIVVMEAMAAGLPVLSTRCGGPNSLITEGETGFFVDVGDVEDLSEKMSILSRENALREQMSENTLAVSKSFDNEVRIKPYLEVYEELSEQGK